MKRFLLLLGFVLTAIGLQADPITVVLTAGTGDDGSGTNYTKTGTTTTSGSTSFAWYESGDGCGLAGIKLEVQTGGALVNVLRRETTVSNQFAIYSSNRQQQYTLTLSAPAGYLITNYSITFSAGNSTYKNAYIKAGTTCNASNYDYESTAYTAANRKTLSVDNVNSSSTQFTVFNSYEKSGTTVRLVEFWEIRVTLEAEDLADADLAYSATSKNIRLGQTPYGLPTLSNPHGLTVTYASSNDAVATVDASGNVTPVAAGTTEITASSAVQTVGGVKYSAGEAAYTLTVHDAALSELSWSAATATLDMEDGGTLPTLSRNPAGLVVTYSSSNMGVATVDPNTGAVTPVGLGETTITAAADRQVVDGETYSTSSASYTLTVTGPVAAGMEWSSSSVRVPQTAAAGDLPTLSNPNGLAVTYTSTDASVATIAADGTITLNGLGSTIIAANAAAQTVAGQRYQAQTATCRLEVITAPTSDATSVSGSFYPTLTNWGTKNVLDVFYSAQQAGRKYPNDADWTSAGFNPDDIAFVRSHVRKHSRIRSTSSDHAIASTSSWKQNRNLYYNVPAGSAKTGANGYPTSGAVDDNFSMWNYVDVHGAWNHGPGHTPGAWIDAAHKNGAEISGGLYFYDSAGSMSSNYTSVYCKDKYVEPMAAMMMYFGHNGQTYNFEDGNETYGGAGNSTHLSFIKKVYAKLKSWGYGDDYHIGIYTTNSTYATSYNYAEYGTAGDGLFAHVMINYSGKDIAQNLGTSQSNYASQVGSAYGHNIYAGVLMSNGTLSFTRLNDNECGICLWGEHSASRFWTFNKGNSPRNQMDNYVELLERGFSGGNQNPNNTPAQVSSTKGMCWDTRAANFQGMASYMAERSSVIGNLPFQTTFQLGNGFVYNYKGRRTAGEWFNMATQDVVPTYRWLVVDDASASTKVTNTSIVPRFSYDDAYIGGSSLKLTGNGTTAGDVVLYKSQLTVSSTNPLVRIAVKTPDEAGATNLQVKLQVNDTWKTFDVGNTGSKNWEEKTVMLNGVSTGDVIKNIALRLTSVDTNTKLYVGKLEVNDDVRATPVTPANLQVKIFNERSTSMTIKAWWDVNQSPNTYGQLFNDEINVDHFELLYKPSETSDITEISRTTQWATLAPDIVIGEYDDPWIGVRSVSTDLKTYSDIVWIHVGHNVSATKSEYGDGYGTTFLGSSGDNSASDLCSYLWIKSAYTKGSTVIPAGETEGKNLDYERSSTPCSTSVTNGSVPNGKAGYPNLVDVCALSNADDIAAMVNPGDKITFYFTHPDNHGTVSISFCVFTAFADWYGVGYFADDAIYSVGNLNASQYSSPYYDSGKQSSECTRKFTFTVPTDAKPGKTRLRLVFQDAWTGFSGATGNINKGVAYDFPIIVADKGQEVGTSPFLSKMDDGEPCAPDGVPGSSVSTWSNIEDGTTFYLTDCTSSASPVVLYNNDGNLASVPSYGDPVISLVASNVGDKYNGRFVARRDGNKIMLVNGHGEYLATAVLTDNYTQSDNEGTVGDGATVAQGPTVSVNGRLMVMQPAEYPLEVTLRPTDAVTIDDSSDNIGIATWSAPFETVLPEDVDAYAISTNNTNEAFLRKLDLTNASGDRVVPANVGVVLITIDSSLPSTGKTFQMLPAKSSAASDAATTLLGAQTAKTYDLDTPVPSSTYYILGVKNGVRKFYKAKTNTGTKLGANKAYLIPVNTNASGMALVFKGDQTAIGKVVTGIDENAPAYDLQGRRVNRDNYKGVYIQNGRKVVKF